MHTKGGREHGREGRRKGREWRRRTGRDLGELATGSGIGIRSLLLRVCF
jgi:hypothetical protein